LTRHFLIFVMTLDLQNELRWKRYPEYKDSGVEWIGEIPAGWEVLKLKNLIQAPLKYGANESGVEFDPALPRYIRITDFSSDGHLDEKNKLSLPLKRAEGYEVEDGDILFARSGATVGKAYQFRTSNHGDSKFSFAGYLIKATPEPNALRSDYLKYFTSSSSYQRWKEVIFNKATIENIGADKYANLWISLPKLNQQKIVCAFLDDKTAKIDEAIRQKERMIELLKERKQILIQQAVTRGLDPDVTMKDSGIEWIGQTPAHWQVKYGNRVFEQRKELARKTDVQLSATQQFGVISQESFEERIGRKVTKVTLHLEKRRHVEIDDFVISMRSFQGGLERAWEQGCIRSSYVVLKPISPVVPKFFQYLFKCGRYIEALQSTANFIRDGQDLNFENFRRVELPVPPISEQEEIGEHIDSAIRKMNEGTEQIQSQITKLREYRATLIDSAVTGKIKVTND